MLLFLHLHHKSDNTIYLDELPPIAKQILLHKNKVSLLTQSVKTTYANFTRC